MRSRTVGASTASLTCLLVLCLSAISTSAFAASEVVDNFDGLSLVTLWGTSDASTPYTYEMELKNSEHVRSGQHALKVSFDKTNSQDEEAAMGAVGLFNLANFDYISFWVYNDGSSLRFQPRIEDAEGRIWIPRPGEIKAKTETSEADWEHIVIDLSRAHSGQINLAAVREIAFVVKPGNSRARGTFWLDDVAVHRAPQSASLEAFEADYKGWLWSGDISFSRTAYGELAQGANRHSLGQYCMKVEWGPKGKNGTYFSYNPVHDARTAASGRIGNYGDLTRNGNKRLDVWIKCDTEDALPIMAKIGEKSLGVATYAGKGAWQKLAWRFEGLRQAQEVDKISFYPYPGTKDDGGALYIDDLTLSGGAGDPVPLAPKTITASEVVEGQYTIAWDAVPGVRNYEIQESTSPYFANPKSYIETSTSLKLRKASSRAAEQYYYRVRSNLREEFRDNYGSFSRAINVGGVETRLSRLP